MFKDVETGTHTVIHNDSEALRECLFDDGIYVGFNSKHYDQFIIKAAANDFTPQEIKQLNDFLIGGGRGWEYAPLKAFYFRFNNVDIRDDVQLGLSLKAIEGHMDFNPRAPCGARQQKCTNHYAHFCDNRQISDAFAQNAACQGILLLFDAGKPCGFWVRTTQEISARLCFAL